MASAERSQRRRSDSAPGEGRRRSGYAAARTAAMTVQLMVPPTTDGEAAFGLEERRGTQMIRYETPVSAEAA
jgi:hypothetical protein